MQETNLLYTLALQHVPKIGGITAKKLISHCGSAEAVFKEKKQNLLKIDGLGSIILSELFETYHIEEAEKELRFIKDNDIASLHFTDDDYPDKLKHCIDGPIMMYYKGNADLSSKKIIAIVGTRKATSYGLF